ncbi:conserved hypothetical protein [Bradyrhizobium sp. STM 3843]|nr:conserved hypothetical protein [Bradyrhizobium sp. STM 3843]
MLVSQLFPLPSLMSLMEAGKRPEARIADRSKSALDRVAKFAPALQANTTPQASEAQLVKPLQAIDTAQAVTAPETAQPPADVEQAGQATTAIDPQPSIIPPQSVDAATATAPSEIVRAEISETAPAAVTPPHIMDPTARPIDTPPVAAPAAASAEADAAAAEKPQPSERPAGSFQIAAADPGEMLPADTPRADVNTASPPDREPSETTASVNAFEVVDECFVVDVCVDRYLWALYQRAPKEDSIKEEERRKVTIKRRGRMVTVTRSFTRLVDEDFAWKDPKAADKAGLTLADYVIGGMDRGFKLKLFHILHAAEDAGLSPGITSAFRDDYRQSIASGLKAANNRSYHGGSFRGGYGHGLAADVVSVKGATRVQRWASTEQLWKWIDAHGKDFGIGRPYLDRDPPHVGPIDGQEYASRRGPAVLQAMAEVRRRKHVAARRDHSAGKHARSEKPSKIRSARAARSRAT